MNKKHQYILARDTIDMIRDNSDSVEVLEYLDSFCFSLARILEQESAVEWDSLASICDQRYYSLRQDGIQAIPLDKVQLDVLYRKYEANIAALD